MTLRHAKLAPDTGKDMILRLCENFINNKN